MQARGFCCWRVVGGKRGRGEHVGSLMHRRKSQSGVSSVKPFQSGGKQAHKYDWSLSLDSFLNDLA